MADAQQTDGWLKRVFRGRRNRDAGAQPGADDATEIEPYMDGGRGDALKKIEGDVAALSPEDRQAILALVERVEKNLKRGAVSQAEEAVLRSLHRRLTSNTGTRTERKVPSFKEQVWELGRAIRRGVGTFLPTSSQEGHAQTEMPPNQGGADAQRPPESDTEPKAPARAGRRSRNHRGVRYDENGNQIGVPVPQEMTGGAENQIINNHPLVGTFVKRRGERFSKKVVAVTRDGASGEEFASLQGEDGAVPVRELSVLKDGAPEPDEREAAAKRAERAERAKAQIARQDEQVERDGRGWLGATFSTITSIVSKAWEGLLEMPPELRIALAAGLIIAVVATGGAAGGAWGISALAGKSVLTVNSIHRVFRRFKDNKGFGARLQLVSAGVLGVYVLTATFLGAAEVAEAAEIAHTAGDEGGAEAAAGPETGAEQEAAAAEAPPEETPALDEHTGEHGTPDDSVYEPAHTPEETLELPIAVSVTANPGDGAISMLMRFAEAARAAMLEGSSFPEGSPMAQLVEAAEAGTLYQDAQRIAIEQGLYRPNEAAESFNVWRGATLGTEMGSDGSYRFMLHNPGGESVSLWSAEGGAGVYEGSNMLDTTSGRSVQAPGEGYGVAESRILTAEEIAARDKGVMLGGEKVDETGKPTSVAESRIISPIDPDYIEVSELTEPAVERVDPDHIEVRELTEPAVERPQAADSAAAAGDEKSVSGEKALTPDRTAADLARIDETVERAVALQSEVLNVTDGAWEVLQQQTLPEVFFDSAAGTEARVQSLVDLAGAHNIALDTEGAGQLERTLSLMSGDNMERMYGSVSFTNENGIRTIGDILREGFFNREVIVR